MKPIVLTLVGLGLLGFLVAASGLFPIAASSGHLAPVEWLLQFGKRRSVATHAWLSVPPLTFDEPWLVLKGAGHFETACRPCHGSPDVRQPRIAQSMLPPPPYLPDRIAAWDADELFYIVKHGLKFTGMPAWPAQERDDEVRATVAFLRALPELDAGEYERLVHGEVGPNRAVAPVADLLGAPPAPRAITATCARCHGADGRGRGNAAFPAIAGQSSDYLHAALVAYERGERRSGMMQPIAAALDERETRALADWYARLPPGPVESHEPAAVERGRVIATRGIPATRVPACEKCHGPGRRADYPRLAGQYADYLVLQLELFRDQRRGGSRFAHLMSSVAPRLTPAQMRDVAAFYASRTP